MTDAPETIWAWNFIASKQNEFMTGGWNDKIELETSGKETEYTRTDISQARIAELEALLKLITDRAEMSIGYNDDFFNFKWIVKKARAALKTNEVKK
jgi:hypothetical protein